MDIENNLTDKYHHVSQKIIGSNGGINRISKNIELVQYESRDNLQESSPEELP